MNTAQLSYATAASGPVRSNMSSTHARRRVVRAALVTALVGLCSAVTASEAQAKCVWILGIKVCASDGKNGGQGQTGYNGNGSGNVSTSHQDYCKNNPLAQSCIPAHPVNTTANNGLGKGGGWGGPGASGKSQIQSPFSDANPCFKHPDWPSCFCLQDPNQKGCAVAATGLPACPQGLNGLVSAAAGKCRPQ